MANIRLLREQMTEVEGRRFGVFRVKLTVLDTQNTDLPREIFLYTRQIITNFDKENPIYGDTCVGVCTIPDIGDYPAFDPDPTTTYQFFRKDYAVWDFRSVIEAKEAIDEVIDRIRLLGQAALASSTLRVAQDFWIPSPPSNSDLRVVSIPSRSQVGTPKLNLNIHQP